MIGSVDEKKIEQAKSLAKKYNREGWGSRGAVFHAIYDIFETGISEDMLKRICSIIDPFHAPASGLYEDGNGYGSALCGALSGGLAGFGLVHGNKELPFKFWTEGMKPDGWISAMLDDPDITRKEKANRFIEHCRPLGYGAYYQITSRFKEHFGTTHCIDLVRPYGEYITPEAFNNCHKVIIWTAGMVTRVLLEYERAPESLEIDERSPLLHILDEE